MNRAVTRQRTCFLTSAGLPFRSTGPCEASRTRRNGAGRLSTPDTGQLDEKLAAKPVTPTGPAPLPVPSPVQAVPACSIPVRFRRVSIISVHMSTRGMHATYVPVPMPIHCYAVPSSRLFNEPRSSPPLLFRSILSRLVLSYLILSRSIRSLPVCSRLGPISFQPCSRLPVVFCFFHFCFFCVQRCPRQDRHVRDMSGVLLAELQFSRSLDPRNIFHMFLYPLS